MSPAAHRVVVGCDGSRYSNGALHWGARQARLTGAVLQPVIGWHWPKSYGYALPVPREYDPAADARQVLDAALQPILEEYPDLDIEPTVVEGAPALSLVALSTDADVLVVGTRGHGEFVGMLIGSVSEYCLTHANCPVVVVHGRGEETDVDP